MAEQDLGRGSMSENTCSASKCAYLQHWGGWGGGASQMPPTPMPASLAKKMSFQFSKKAHPKSIKWRTTNTGLLALASPNITTCSHQLQRETETDRGKTTQCQRWATNTGQKKKQNKTKTSSTRMSRAWWQTSVITTAEEAGLGGSWGRTTELVQDWATEWVQA